jgi:large subunit ribosomal protein L28
MAKQCEVCGKTPVFGNQVSHAHNITSRRWLPNLQRIRVLVNGSARRMNVCTRCIRSNRVQKAVR